MIMSFDDDSEINERKFPELTRTKIYRNWREVQCKVDAEMAQVDVVFICDVERTNKKFNQQHKSLSLCKLNALCLFESKDVYWMLSTL